jgi:hypothetical protein
VRIVLRILLVIHRNQLIKRGHANQKPHVLLLFL